MSSIRLFILSSFAEHGPMHGHRLRLQAEQAHVHLWTEITVGAVYGAMKRLATEGLLEQARREQEGLRPARQVYAITDQGRDALRQLRDEGLREVWFRYDPFDLALTRLDETAEPLAGVVAARLASVEAMLAESRRVNAKARPTVGLAKQWALKHTEYRLEAEVAYLTDLLRAAPGIACDDDGSADRS